MISNIYLGLEIVVIRNPHFHSPSFHPRSMAYMIHGIKMDTPILIISTLATYETGASNPLPRFRRDKNIFLLPKITQRIMCILNGK